MTTTTAGRTTTVGELIDSIWVASALATALGEPELPDEDPAVEMLALAGLVERNDTGWVPTESLRAEVPPERIDVARERLASVLGQAATIAALGPGRSWDSYGDEVLLAQGRLSAAVSRAFASMLSSMPDLAAVVEHCQVIIDAGVGVAGAACTICETLPDARVIGLDVNPRALGLARKLAAAKGLSDRIELRLQGVEELQDVGVASVGHIPPQFIPRPAVIEGIGRMFRALRPGGILLLDVSGQDAEATVDRWQAYNAGGSAMTLTECAEVVTAAGFEQPKTPPNLPPGAPLAYCRRP